MAISRRNFLRTGCCAAAAFGAHAGLSPFGLLNAFAQSTGSYKAMVCVFLFGGNDGNNILVPLDSSNIAAGFRYTDYAALRGAQTGGGLALTQTELLPVTARTAQPSGVVNFGFHPGLAQMRALFQQNRLAVVANVGALVEPLTRTDYFGRAKRKPANLFSHSDQQQQWQTADLSGFGTTGWGGRIADRVQGAYNSGAIYPPITTVAGTAIFCTGSQTRPFALVPNTTPGLQGFSGSAASNARLQSLQEMVTMDTGVSLIQATSSITGNALAQSSTLANSLQGVTLQTVFPTTDLGRQLAQVAKIVKVHGALSLNRQMFFCSQGGYDTHSNQIQDQNNLLRELDTALKAFYDATNEIGAVNDVTTFVVSDFGRALQPASEAGSDHGWASNVFVLGGSVLGGDVYGRLPQFALGGPEDSSSAGRWIPSTSIDQYGATLASWFGVQPADLPSVFGNLNNFSAQNLGFMA
jgi:uncharacterized protein (DUF1501 family)